MAVALVVLWHYLGISSGGVLYTIFRPGRSGVDLFFVLSGFLITSILIANRGSSGYYSTFYIRRAARILPVYAVMVFLFVAGRAGDWSPALFGGDFGVWTYAVFLQNVEMSWLLTYGPEFLTPTWSLAVEEQFYLIFPLLVALVSPRSLPKVLLGIALVAPVLRFATYSGFGYLPAYVMMPTRADSLAVGALIAWALANARPWLIANRDKMQFACLAIIALAPIIWMVPRETRDWHAAIWGHTYFTLLYGAILLIVLLNSGNASLWLLRTRLAAGLAAISYALYLVHLPVLLAVYAAFDATQNLRTANGVALVLLALSVSVGLSAISYFVIERPIIGLGHRFSFVAPDQQHVAERKVRSL